MQENTKNKVLHVRNEELQQNIITLITNPSKTKPVVDLLNKKEDEIHRLKKKLQMLVTQHSDFPELVALQEERDKIYKEMLIFKEKVIEYKEKVAELEKENEDLLVYRVTTPQ